MSTTGAVALAQLLADVELEGALCVGSPVEYVDPNPADVDGLLAVCRVCPVVAACRERGDALAPHRYPAIYGARFYAPTEPVDGWEVAS